MTISRYDNTPILGLGNQYGTSNYHVLIRNAIKNGDITYETISLKGFERLDILAGKLYGDGRYWWILAAASDIGWGLQIPPGTEINIPNLTQVLSIIQ